MADVVKLTDEELNSIRAIQDGYATVTAKFGHVEVQKMLIQKQLDAMETLKVELAKEYGELELSEQKIHDSIVEKYGEGSVNIENGTFTPSPTQ